MSNTYDASLFLPSIQRIKISRNFNTRNIALLWTWFFRLFCDFALHFQCIIHRKSEMINSIMNQSGKKLDFSKYARLDSQHVFNFAIQMKWIACYQLQLLSFTEHLMSAARLKSLNRASNFWQLNDMDRFIKSVYAFAFQIVTRRNDNKKWCDYQIESDYNGPFVKVDYFHWHNRNR